MPAIFFLDVPEFRPFVEHARGLPGCGVDGPRLGYFRVASEGRLEFQREPLGLKPAVWHGALTGGLVGRSNYPEPAFRPVWLNGFWKGFAPLPKARRNPGLQAGGAPA